PRALELRALEGGPVALEGRLALGELGSQRTVVEREENVSLLDLLAFVEMDILDLPVDARLDHHGRHRLDAADRRDLNRHRRFDRDIGDHWLSRGGRARPGAPRLAGKTGFAATCCTATHNA